MSTWPPSCRPSWPFWPSSVSASLQQSEFSSCLQVLSNWFKFNKIVQVINAKCLKRNRLKVKQKYWKAFYEKQTLMWAVWFLEFIQSYTRTRDGLCTILSFSLFHFIVPLHLHCSSSLFYFIFIFQVCSQLPNWRTQRTLQVAAMYIDCLFN